MEAPFPALPRGWIHPLFLGLAVEKGPPWMIIWVWKTLPGVWREARCLAYLVQFPTFQPYSSSSSPPTSVSEDDFEFLMLLPLLPTCWDDSFFFFLSFLDTDSHYVAQTDLTLMEALLPQPL